MSSGNSSLTPRERDVLFSLTDGQTTREIAVGLHLAESTVKAHLGSIYGKLGVANRTQAAVVGLRMWWPTGDGVVVRLELNDERRQSNRSYSSQI
jgi:DNA-binding NarL/FixJ family response regulator